MGCFVIFMAMLSPRLALFFVWVFTDLVNRAFDSWVAPALGFLFLPWTTLVYVLVYDDNDVSALGWFFFALALVADLSSYGWSSRRYRTRAI